MFAAGGGGGGGAGLSEGRGDGAGLGEGSGDAAAGLGEGVDTGVGDGSGVGDSVWIEGVGRWLAGTSAIRPCEDGDGVFVWGTVGGPDAMAATTIAIRAIGAISAETYARVATTIFHAVFERYPGILANHDAGAVVAVWCDPGNWEDT
jgi:hypothetical protein